MVLMRIGDRIRLLREKRGKTQGEVCASLGLEQSTLANYEKSRRTPKVDIIIALAKFFHVSTDYLLGCADSPCIRNVINDNDMDQFLLQSNIIFKGHTVSLSDKDRKILRQALEIAFMAIKNGESV